MRDAVLWTKSKDKVHTFIKKAEVVQEYMLNFLRMVVGVRLLPVSV